MLGILGTLLGFVPGLLNIATTLINAHFNAQVAMYQAKTGANRDVAVAAINAEVAETDRWWFLAAIKGGFELVALIYFGKCVVWDKVFSLGSTDPLTGNIGWAFNTVVLGMFASAIANQFLKTKY